MLMESESRERRIRTSWNVRGTQNISELRGTPNNLEQLSVTALNQMASTAHRPGFKCFSQLSRWDDRRAVLPGRRGIWGLWGAHGARGGRRDRPDHSATPDGHWANRRAISRDRSDQSLRRISRRNNSRSLSLSLSLSLRLLAISLSLSLSLLPLLRSLLVSEPRDLICRLTYNAPQPQMAAEGAQECGRAERGREPREEEDVISRAVGVFGKWQLQLTFFLSLFNLPCTWHIFAMTFQAPPVDFWCAPPPPLESLPTELWRNISHTPPLSHNARQKDNPCRIWDVDYENRTLEDLVSADFLHQNTGTRECQKWVYDEPAEARSLVSQWDLVCSRDSLKETAEMAFLAGVAVGGLVSGILSDRFGRKKTLMTSLSLQIVVGVAMAFAPWIELFLVLRSLLGFISVSVVFSGFVLCIELVGGDWRTISGVSYLFPVPLSYIAFAGIAYFVRDWKAIQLAITLPALFLLGLWWILPESPRWLLAMGKHEENVEILKEAARTNKKVLPPNIDKLLQQSSAKNDNNGESVGVLDLFRYPKIRKKSLVLYVIWFAVYFVYYGLIMNLGNIGGDIYINTVISGVVEVPAIAISILVLVKMGRRWPLCLTMLGSGLACLLTLPFGQDHETLTITLAMFGKFSISSSNAIMPVYTAELFPTVIRNLGVGASNVSAGIALVLVPYLWNLAAINLSLPMGLLGACGVVGGLSVLVLEETANRPMINTLEEGEK